MRIAGVLGLKLVALLALGCLGGCSLLQAGKLMAPESFGLAPVAPRIYVEVGADAATQAGLRAAMEQAELSIRSAYGSVTSRPVVHACITEACYAAFGGRGSVAKVYGDRILLSPRGLNSHFLAHEWSHAELLSRLTCTAWWRMPRWFDEGVAVVVSAAPEHSEEHWQALAAARIPRPAPGELRTLHTLRQWLDAVRRYGDAGNIERRARGEPEIRPVYAAAGHELRPWMAQVGSQGLLAFIDRMNGGMAFEAAYQPSVTEHRP